MSAVAVERRPIDLSWAGPWRYWARNVAVFRKTWLLGLMAWFLEPVIYLVAMGTGLGRYLESIQGVPYIEFIAPGLLAVAAMWGATFEASWNAHWKLDRAGVYDACIATPVSVEDVAVGEALWATTRALIYGACFAVVATPFGVFASWWGLLTIPSLVLVGWVFSITALSYTYASSRIDYLAYYWTLFLTPMFMFAGVFFPLSRLPDWVRGLAWFMPLHHAAELMRGLMRGEMLGQVAGHAAWLLVVGALLTPAPIAILRRRMIR